MPDDDNLFDQIREFILQGGKLARVDIGCAEIADAACVQ